MKKIFFFCIVLIIIFSLSLSVLAAEIYSFTFPYMPESFDQLFIFSCPSRGNYRYSLKLILGDGSEFPPLSFSGVCSVYSGMVNFEGEVGEGFYLPLSLKSGSFSLNFICNWAILEPGLYLFYITSSNGDLSFELNGSELILEKLESPGFVQSVNSGVISVINWINSFASAFLAGELSPLLSVFVLGICIAALFLAIRFIYKACWGC